MSAAPSCFCGIAPAGFEHQPLVTAGGHPSTELPGLRWANTVPGNFKTTMTGTCHHTTGKHLPRYLGEFCVGFNRRFKLAPMLPRLGWAAVRTPPMPHRLLTLMSQVKSQVGGSGP